MGEEVGRRKRRRHTKGPPGARAWYAMEEKTRGVNFLLLPLFTFLFPKAAPLFPPLLLAFTILYVFDWRFRFLLSFFFFQKAFSLAPLLSMRTQRRR